MGTIFKYLVLLFLVSCVVADQNTVVLEKPSVDSLAKLPPSAPSSITVQSPGALGNSPRPVLLIGGVLQGQKITVYSDANCTTKAGEGFSIGGATPITLIGLGSDASYTFSAKATNESGLTSGCFSSAVGIYTLDRTPPAAPSGWTMSSPTSNTTSNDYTPVISGSTPENVTIQIYDNSTCTGTPVGTGSGTGAFTISNIDYSSLGAAQVSKLFYATLTDQAGNINYGGCTNLNLLYKLDTLAPANPTSVSLGLSYRSPGNTSNPVFEVKGVESSNTIRLYSDACSTQIGSGIAGGINTEIMANIGATEGTKNIYVQVSDEAGNLSGCTLGTTYILDTTPPANPSGWTMSSPSNGSVSNDQTPIISAGSLTDANNGKARIYADSECKILKIEVDIANNSFSATNLFLPVQGSYSFYGILEDQAGNTSSCTNLSLGYTLDLSAPTNPTGLALSSPSNGSVSNDRTPIITGAGFDTEIGAKIEIYDDPTCSNPIQGSATIDNLGNFSVTNISYPVLLQVEQVKRFYGKIIDTAGNTNAGGCTDLNLSYTLDTLPPAPPTSLTMSDPTTNTSNNPTPKILLSPLKVGEVAKLYSDFGCITEVGSQTADSTSAVVESNFLAGDGTYFYYGRVKDPAGNLSSCTIFSQAYIYKITPPDPPSGWTLVNPLNNSFSNNTSPAITGNVNNVPDTYSIKVFTDSSCTELAGSEGITSGSFTTSSLSISGDGYKRLYGQVVDNIGNPSACTDLGIGYTLDTVAPSNIASLSWSLSFPGHNTISRTTDPKISGYGIDELNGFSVEGFSDLNNGGDGCDKSMGSATVINGSVIVDPPSGNYFNNNSTEDGLKKFFIKVTDLAGNTSTCVDINQSYTLDTNPPDGSGDYSFTNISNGSISSQTNPIIAGVNIGGGAVGDESGTVQFYSDAFCVSPIGTSASLTNGTMVNVTNVNFSIEGVKEIYVIVTDLGFTPSPCTFTGLTYRLDLTPPNPPSSLVMTSPSNGAVSQDSTPIITGIISNEVAGQVRIYDNSLCTSLVSTSSILDDGSFSTGAQIDFGNLGPIEITKTYYVIVEDMIGQLYPCNPLSLSHTIDTLPPSTPQPLALFSPASNPANSTSPQITINGVASGDNVAIYNNSLCNEPSVTTVVAAGASVNATIPGPLTHGNYQWYAKSTDAAGNISGCTPSSGRVHYELDLIPPNAPLSWNLSSPANGSYSTDHTPVVSAINIFGEEGASVKVYTDASCSTLVGAGETVASDSFTEDDIVFNEDKTFRFYGTITDRAGNLNVGGCTDLGLSYILDRSVPPEPVGWTMAIDTGSGGYSNDTQPTFSGSVANAETVIAKIFSDNSCSTQIASGSISGGTFSATSSALPNTAGTLYNFYGKTTTLAGVDNAGGCTDLSLTYTLDTTAPATPSAPVLISPSSSPFNDSTPEIQMTGVASGDIVTVYSDAGCTNAYKTVTAASTTVNVTLDALGADGTYPLYAKSVDLATNQSSCSAVTNYVLDTQSPSVTAIALVNPGSTPGNVTTPTLSITGTFGASDTVKVFSDTLCATEIGSVTSTGSPQQITTSVLTAGSYNFSALSIDQATNQSLCYTPGSEVYFLDLTQPSLSPVMISSNNSINNSLAKVGDVITLSFTSSETLGATPTVNVLGSSASVTNPSSNNFVATYSATGTDADGLVNFTIDFVDVASNPGTQVTATTDSSSVTFDKIPPAHAGSVLTFTNDYNNSGNNINTSWSAFTDTNGILDYKVTTYTNSGCSTGAQTHGYFGTNATTNTVDIDGLAEGTFYAKITAKDGAGNEGDSLCSSDFIIIDTTAPTPGASVVTFTDTHDNDGDNIDVSWTAFTDANGMADYKIITYTDSGCSGGAQEHGYFGTTATTNTVDIDGLAEGTYWAKVRGKDVAGNEADSNCSSDSIIVDTTPPTITNVTSPKADGTYNLAESIDINVTFSENVYVVTTSGTPSLTLETGVNDTAALYTTGDATDTITFNYVVVDGDVTTDLEYQSTSALALNSGTIKDAAGNSATLTLPTLAATGSLSFNKNLDIVTELPKPTPIVLNTPASSPGDSSKPSFDVGNLNANYDTVKLYSDNTCTTEIGSKTVSAATETVAVTNDLASSLVNVYAKAFRGAATSQCSDATVQYVVNPKFAPLELSEAWTPQWSSLLAYYKMEGNWSDTIGSFDGTALGSAGFTTSSKLGSNAGDFTNSVDDRVSFGDIDTTTAMTFAGWVYLEAHNTTWDLIATKWNDNTGPSYSYHFALVSKKLQLEFSDNGTTFYTASLDTENFPIQKWTHVAFSVDTATDEIKIYKNGHQVGSTYTYTPASIPTNNEPFILGNKANHDNGVGWNGRMDEVGLWSVALSAAQIKDIYNHQIKHIHGGLSGGDVAPLEINASWTPQHASLVSYWDFNENAPNIAPSGSDFEDKSANSYHLTESGTVDFNDPGKINGAVELKDTSDYLVYDNFPMPTDTVTVAFWFNSNYTSNNLRTPFHYSDGGNNNFSIEFYNTDDDFKANINNTAVTFSASAGKPWSDGRWHHYVVTWRSSDGQTKGYIDGNLISTQTSSTTSIPSTNSCLVLGQEQDSDCGGFATTQAAPGFYDELGIWNAVLTDAEVAKLYNTQVDKLNKINIYGSYFSASGNDVEVGGVDCTSITHSTTKLTCLAPVNPDGDTVISAKNVDVTNSHGATGVDPLSYRYLGPSSDLRAWYDGADITNVFQDSACSTAITSGGQTLGCWRDKSGNTHNAQQTTASREPTFHGHPRGLTFDGTDDYLSAWSIASANIELSAHSYVSGFKVLSGASQDSSPFAFNTSGDNDEVISVNKTTGVISHSDTGGGATITTTNILDQDAIFTLTLNTNTTNALNSYINGILEGTINDALESATRFSIGTEYDSGPSASNYLKGDFKELLLYDRVITSTERQLLEDYIDQKYAIGKTPPFVYSSNIASNHGGNNAISEPTDVVTLTFTLNEAPSVGPTVTIFGNSVTPTLVSGLTYTATYTTTTSNPSGAVPFTIDFTDKDGNAATQVTSTTDSSVVLHSAVPSPTGLALIAPTATTPGTNPRPSVSVSGVTNAPLTITTVKLYDDSNCTNLIGSVARSGDPQTITATKDISSGSVNLYAKNNDGTNDSLCSTATVAYAIAPLFAPLAMSPSWTPKYDNIVGYWNMDNDFNDSIGSNDGTASAGATFSTSSHLGSHSGSFSGAVDERVTVNHDVSINFGTNTYSFWIKTDGNWGVDGTDGGTSVKGRAALITKDSTSGDGFGSHLDPSGKISFLARGSGANSCGPVVGTSILTDDNWHHIVLVLDVANGYQNKIYVDGNLEVTCTNTISAVAGTKPLLFGDSNDPYDEEYSGLIDEVIAWNTGLTASEVKDIYNHQIKHYHAGLSTGANAKQEVASGWTPQHGSIVGYWKMNNDFNDSIGTHHGSETNGVTFTTSSQQGSHAASFTGASGEGITIPSNAAFDTANQTFSLWFKSDGSWATDGGDANDQAILFSRHNSSGTTEGFTLILGKDGVPRIQIKNATQQYTLNGSGNYVENEWHQVTVVIGQANGSTISLYVDGVLNATGTLNIAWTYNNQDLLIGRGSDPFWEEYKGEIDDVVVWNTSLSASEIAKLYEYQSEKFNRLNIYGSYFSNSGNTVTVGGSNCTNLTESKSVLNCDLPANPDGTSAISIKDIGVTNAGTASATDTYSLTYLGNKSDLRVWFDASDSNHVHHTNNNVFAFGDKTGNAFDGLPGVSTATHPKWIAGAGRRVVNFDGTDDYLNISNAIFNGVQEDLDFFTVARTITTGNDSILVMNPDPDNVNRFNVHIPWNAEGKVVLDFGGTDANSRANVAWGGNTNDFFQWEFFIDGANDTSVIYRDYVNIAQNNSHTSTWNNSGKTLDIARYNRTPDYWNGNIAEFLIYDKPLNTTERRDIAHYLDIKWGLGKVPPFATSVSLASSNTNSARAVPTDTITLTFTLVEAPSSTPVVTILGQAATVTLVSGFTYTATYTTTAGLADGWVPFTLNFSDKDNNAATTVTATTDSSKVFYSEYSPTPETLALVTPASSPSTNNTPLISVTGTVANGDTVTLYSDSDCTTSIGSAVSAGASVNVLTSELTSGSTTIYAQRTNGTDISFCSTASLTYGIIPSIAPVTLQKAWLPKASNVQAYYRFDGNLLDGSGNGNHGVAHNNATTTLTNARINQTAVFDGVDDAIDSNYELSATSGRFSWASWLRTNHNDNATWHIAAAKWTNTGDITIHFGIEQTSGKFEGRIAQSNGANITPLDTESFPINKWQHMAVVADGSNVKLYRNGKMVSSVAYDGTLGNLGNGCPVWIGDKGDGTTCTNGRTGSATEWDGEIDEMVFWNESLTDAEVQKVYDYQRKHFHSGPSIGAEAKDQELDISWAPSYGNIVGYWPLNGNANDAIGSYHGTAQGDASFTTSSKRLGTHGATFDGSGDYINVPYNAALNTNSFSASIWAKPTGGVNSFRAPIGNRSEAGSITKGFNLYASSGNTWQAWLGKNTTGWTNISPGIPVVLNEWVHLLVTFEDDDNNGNGTYRFYFNGKLVGSVVSNHIENPSAPLQIGDNGGNGTDWFGELDEVIYWNKALSPGEVQKVYDHGAGRGKITIRGSYFTDTGNTIDIGGSACTNITHSSTLLTCDPPANPDGVSAISSKTITVTNSAGASAVDPFAYTYLGHPSDLRSWIDASDTKYRVLDSSNKYISIGDKSSNGFDFRQETAANRPTFFDDTNSGYTLDFDGTDDHMDLLGGMLGNSVDISGVDIFSVNKIDDTNSTYFFTSSPDTLGDRFNIHLPWGDNNVYWDFGNEAAGGRIFTNYGLNTTDYFIWEFQVDDDLNSSHIYRDSTSIVSDTTFSEVYNRSNDPFVLGTHPTHVNFWDGKLNEFLIYDRALTTSERNWVNHYLDAKWKLGKNKPFATSVSIKSDNSAPNSNAGVGDTITLTFTLIEEPSATPTVNILGKSATVTLVSGTTYTATVTTANTDTNGEVSFTLNFNDKDGQSANQVTSTTDGSKVIFTELTAPSGIALKTPATSPGDTNTPEVTVSGVQASDVVSVYTDSECLNEVGTATSGTTTVDITVRDLPAASNTLYAKLVRSGEHSPCSTANVAYVVNPRIAPIEISSSWVPKKDNLVAHYRMNNNSNDMQGSFDGSDQGNVSYVADLKLGSHAARFDGAGDFINIGEPLGTGNYEEMTASAWIKIDDVQTWQCILADWNNLGTERSFHWCLNGNQPRLDVSSTGLEQLVSHHTGMTFETGVWYHYAVSFKKGEIKHYVNGKKVYESTVATGSIYHKSGNPMGIGAKPNALNANVTDFDGDIDELSIWNKKLEDSEIASLYNHQVSHYYAGPSDGSLGPKEIHSSWTPQYSDIVAYWDLDDSADSQIGNIKGTLRNGASFVSDSRMGQGAVSFDGTNDFIELAEMNPDYSNGITISAWVYFNSFSQSYSRILDFGNGPNSENLVFTHIGTSTKLGFAVNNVTSSSDLIEATGSLETGKWTHVLATIDSGGNGVLYKNGTQVASGTMNIPRNIVRKLNYIGRSNWSQDGYFDGKIDEIVIWKKGLTAGEVTTLYNNQSPVNGLNLYGSYFSSSGNTVTIGGTACSNPIHFVDQIICDVAANPDGNTVIKPKDIVVNNAAGGSGVDPFGYYYLGNSSDLKLWLDARSQYGIEENGSNVSNIRDRSGNNFEAYQATAASQPTLLVDNGMTHLNFDGADDTLKINDSIFNDATVTETNVYALTLTDCSVCQDTFFSSTTGYGSGNRMSIHMPWFDTVNNYIVWDFGDLTPRIYEPWTGDFTNYILWEMEVNDTANTSRVYRNANVDYEITSFTDTYDSNNDTFNIGSGPAAEYWDGKLSELLIYDRALNTTEKRYLRHYFDIKWNRGLMAPWAETVTISSNNADPAKSVTGNVITLEFTLIEPPSSTPTVNLMGNSLTPVLVSGTTYRVTYTVTGSDPGGIANFTIDFSDKDGNAAAQITTTTDNTRVVNNSTNKIWPFTNPSNYVLSDANKMSISGGILSLLQLDQVDNTQSEFDAGEHFGTMWDSTNNALTIGGGLGGRKLGSWAPQFANLRHYWAFDGNWNDSIGSLNITPESANSDPALISTNKKIGSQAADFDGDDYGLISSTLSDSFVNNITVSAWVYTRSAAAWGMILSEEWTGGGDEIPFYLGFDDVNTSRITAGFYDGTIHKNCDSPNNITLNQWVHVVASYDGANIKIYENGVLVSTCAHNVSLPTDNGESWRIGRRWDFADYFDGVLDELGIWNVTLTDDEVRTLYQNQAPSVKEELASSWTPKWSNLVSYWNFNSNANDSIGGNNGTLNGNAAISTDAKIGSHSMAFDGSGDWISVPHNNNGSLDLRNSFTVGGWVKLNSLANQGFYEKTINDAVNKQFSVFYESNVVVFRLLKGLTAYNVSSNQPLTTGSWYHIMATYDGSTARLYINGQLQTDTEAVAAPLDGGHGATLMGHLSGTYPLNGNMDEFALWNVALNKEEIGKIFDKQSPYYSGEHHANWTPQWSNVVGYWNFNENWSDKSGKGLHGTPVGTNLPFFNTDSHKGTHSADFGNDSENRAVQIPASLSDQIGNNITINAWVKPRALCGTSNVCGIFNEAYLGDLRIAYALGYRTTGGVYSGYHHTGWTLLDTTATLPLNEWTMVSTTYDQSNIKIYFNGVEVASMAATDALPTVNGEVWYIGKVWVDNYNFPGKIDETIVWNTALSAAEIQNIYQRQSSQFSGEFRSRIMGNAGSSAAWDTMNWITSFPYGKELPSTSEVSGDYSAIGANLMNGLVALWQMNNNWNDSSGNGHDAITVGPPSFNSLNKKLGTHAGEFDGASDYLTVNETGIDNFSTFSISSWVYPRETNITILTNRGTSARVEIQRSNCDFRNGTNYILSFNTPLKQNTWSHVVCTYDGSNLRLYVNGVLDNSMSASGPADLSGSTGWIIGYTASGGVEYFNGLIDELALWSRSLSASEVIQLYRRGANRLLTQIRSCDDDMCEGESFVGPDGTVNTYFSELYNNDNFSSDLPSGSILAGKPSVSFSTFTGDPANNPYFQYRVVMESDDANSLCSSETCIPDLKSMDIGPSHYWGDAHVTNAASDTVAFADTLNWVETAGGSCTPKYQFSHDGTNFYYFDGSNWVIGDETTVAQRNNVSTANSNFSTFNQGANIGDLYFRAFLETDGAQACTLDQLEAVASVSPTLVGDDTVGRKYSTLTYAKTCKAYLDRLPGSPSGKYIIDPDGANNGLSPFEVYCDMTTDGGGWTIIHRATGAASEQSLVSDTEVSGNALTDVPFNISRAKKVAISNASTESIFIRDGGTIWMKVNHPIFSSNAYGDEQTITAHAASGNDENKADLTVANSHWAKDGLTCTPSAGSADTNCTMGWSNFNISGGGDFGVTTSAGFDHHLNSYLHLNAGCGNSYIYSYGGGAGYDANTALGTSWTVTDGCHAAAGSVMKMYSGMR